LRWCLHFCCRICFEVSFKDLGGEGAFAEARTDALARGDLSSVSQKCAGKHTAFEVDEGVPAREDGDGRKGVEAGGGAVEAGAAGRDDLPPGAIETLAGLREAMPTGKKAVGGILPPKPDAESGETLATDAEEAGGGGFEAQAEVVEALLAAGDGVVDAGEDVRGREAGEALAGVEEVEAAGAEDGAAEIFDALPNAVLGGGDDLGGGGGSGGAEVGDEVGDGEVGLVADGGDDGKLGDGDGAGEGFVVEAGEVFGGAAAAGQDDELDPAGIAIEPADASGDGAGAVVALHGGGVNEEVEAGVAAADDGEDVADNGAAGRGDDADAPGVGGQRAFAGGVEEAFGEETGFELVEGELEGTGTAGFHGFGDELELAAGLVDGDAAAHEDGEAVGGAETKELGLAAEEDDGELRLAILKREVDVAGGGWAAGGDFALDPEVGVAELDALADIGNEGADAPDAAFGGG